MVPIMLAMGVHPGVVAATSSAMILFTSFASVTAFWIFGLILPDFAVVGFLVGFVSSMTGQLLHRQARQARSASGRNFERNSYTGEWARRIESRGCASCKAQHMVTHIFQL